MILKKMISLLKIFGINTKTGSIMKRLFYLMMASALILAGGCTKEQVTGNDDVNKPEELPQPEPPVEFTMVPMTLNAAMAECTADVKALIDAEGAFGWTADDAIAVNVHYTDESGNEVDKFFKFEMKEISSENDNVAVFAGEIPSTGKVSGVAVYPYDELHAYAGGELTVNFPAVVSEKNHLPVMYAKVGEGTDLQFEHLSSMLKVTYRFVPKGTDMFTLTSDHVAGLHAVNIETGALTATASATNQISVPFDALSTMYEEKSVFVPVPAGEREFAVQLHAGEIPVKWSDFSSKESREYAAGHIALLPEIDVHFTELFVLGDSKELWNWSYGDMVAMEEVQDHIFTWTGSIGKDNKFRFPIENYWWPAIYKSEAGVVVLFADPEAPNKEPKADGVTDFMVQTAGNYTLTVNTTDMDNITVDIKLNEAQMVYPDLYVVGSATDWGYSTNPTDKMWMEQVENGVFVWEGHLSSTGEFKFYTEKDHKPSYNRDADASDYWTLTYRTDYSQPDAQFQVAKSGTYKLTADLNTMNLKAELLKEDAYQKLYGIGEAFDWGWSLDNCEELTYQGDGVYTWTGNLAVDKEFKFLLQKDWGAHYGPATSGQMDGKAVLHESGDYKYKLPSSSYTSGVHTVVLDINKGTITVTPQK